jgi:exodeoxyribonuclease VII small subunit
MSKQNSTISEKMAQLSELVAWFESDEFTIETATAKFAEAEKLAKEIESNLSEFKNEITVLKKKFDQE